MRRITTSLLTTAVLLSATIAPAYASCLLDERPLEERLADHPLVFVGTTTELRDDGRSAAFRVEEVWRGEAGAEVIVHGGSPDAPGVTSIDRFFAADTRYVVAARAEGSAWVSDSCMPTEEWDEERHAAARPASASAPTGDDGGAAAAGSENTGDAGAAASEGNALVPAAVAVALLAGIGGWLLWRRRADASV